MLKRVAAATVLLVLFGITVYTVLENQKDSNSASSNENQNISSSEGTGMTPPNAPEGLKVGEAMPDVELKTLDGETVQLSDFKGEKIFLNFWATWCPPCRVEMPEMQEFHEKYGDDVKIIAINATGTEKGVEKVKQFVEENGYTFTILLDPKLKANTQFRATALPTTYFIGSNGLIQAPRKVGPMTKSFMEKKKDELK
ncbi:TlpA family protein disulfide reductase [Pontibacillus marinus]|uniref:Cytochrome C biogenesis protein n=1 Tax=Pontibacillus marinus BH030004 = DSM 16465 TaxID=1385511 RepID=A0A0A5FQW5_9BACI|nr:TlpA disulfide reductase family protein [Pontibacillus marinus]KGX83171.1 cytochrome C biogenesis protein [Pontibacillus marinus BH030004 = DSM 16465]